MQRSCVDHRRRLTGTTALTVLAAGTLALSGGHAIAVNINDGVTVIAVDNAAIGGAAGETVTFVGDAAYNPANGAGANAILHTFGTFSTARDLTFNNFGGRIDTNSGTTLTSSGQITSGPGASFIKQGAGTLILTGDSSASFAGSTRVDAGLLEIQGKLGGANGYISDGAQVKVSGTWTTTTQFIVGDRGAGFMTVEAGGKVTSGASIIGSGGASAVMVTGAGSEWTVTAADIYVGHFGATGELTVAAGGNVKVGATGTGTINAGIFSGNPGGTINIGAAEANVAAAAGTLQAGTIALNATASKLVFNHTETNYAFSQTISGEGTVRQIAGTTVLSGTNTYKGGTVIKGGVLQVANDGNLGDATGGIEIGDGTLRASAGFTSGRALSLTSDATIEIETGDLILNGNITGAGSLTKTGADTLRLFGTNSYLGGTTVEDGTLLGNTASLQGNILNEAKLIFDQTTNGTYGGVLTSDGTGITSKEGAGILTFTADSSAYDGETYVNEGTLLVNGKLGGAMYVANDATLGGNGAVGKTTIASGGIHAPGNSIDTQTVNGDYANHGILEIEATPAAADKVVVNGTVDITGATLRLVLTPPAQNASPGWPPLTGPYVIIENDGTDLVQGTFSVTDVNNLLFLDEIINYNVGVGGNDVTLELVRNDVDFVDVAETRNQRATAGAIDTLTNTNAVWAALAMAGSEEEARALLDQLSGEVHASLIGMLNQDSRFWRNAANDRLRSAFNGVAASGGQVMGFSAAGVTNAPADTQGPALWTRGFGSWAKTDSDGNAAEFTRNTGGILAGADMGLAEATRLGVLAGYAHSSFDADDRDSSGDADSFQIGLYGGTQIDALGLRAGIAYAWHDIDTERHALGDKLTADYDADTVQVFGEAGYIFDLDTVRLEPFANAAYVSTQTDDFEEDGGPAALSSDSETTDNTFTTLGLRAAMGFNMGEMPASFRAMAGWRHAFGDMAPETTFAFEGSEDFVIAGAPIARDAAVLEAGFDLNISSDATLGVAYSGEIGDDAEDHGLNATLAAAF